MYYIMEQWRHSYLEALKTGPLVECVIGLDIFHNPSQDIVYINIRSVLHGTTDNFFSLLYIPKELSTKDISLPPDFLPIHR